MGAGAALVGDLAVNAYQVETFRRGAVGFINGIVHFFNDYGQPDMQVQAARLGDLLPLGVALVLAKEDAVL